MLDARVLVLSAAKHLRERIASALRQRGYTVIDEVVDENLQQGESTSLPDLVIVDRSTATGSSKESRTVLDTATARDIPVLVLDDAPLGTDIADEAKRFYLPQPFSSDDLLASIARILDTAKNSRPAVTEWDARLREHFQQSLVDRLSVLDQACSALVNSSLSAVDLATYSQHARSLAESLATFGLLESAAMARTIARMMSDPADDNGTRAALLSARIAKLRAQLIQDADPGQPPPATELSVENAQLLIVSADVSLTNGILKRARARGIVATALAGSQEAREWLRIRNPDIIVLDLTMMEGVGSPSALLEELSNRLPNVPILVFTGRGALVDRVEAAHLGARAFLRKPVPPDKVIGIIVHLLRQRQAGQTKVLAVTRDSAVIANLNEVLEAWGVRVQVLGNADGINDVLANGSADLLVLDHAPDVCDVARVCLDLRESRWRVLSILAIVEKPGAETLEALYAAGIDDYVTKPLVPAEILARINAQLERARLQRILRDLDPLTGLANRRKWLQMAEQALSMGLRQNQPVTVALMDLDHYKEINDAWGQITGDDVLCRIAEILRRTFRGEDTIARIGGQEFGLVMYGMSRDDGVHRVAQLLERIRQERFAGGDASALRLTYSAGIAQAPLDGKDLPTLYRSADRALCSAKAEGRDRVHPAGWNWDFSTGDPTCCDLIVLKETRQGDSLFRALETRGYRVCWLWNIEEAIEVINGLDTSGRLGAVIIDITDLSPPSASTLRTLFRVAASHQLRVILRAPEDLARSVGVLLRSRRLDVVAADEPLAVVLRALRRAMADRRAP